ncbi:hypothetical protein KIS4809_1940 [Bacillus sp. ZZV12-4809]|nr:hypothetical protein KIS4809_1940 [Bacillus sp. ZZV12-4809]
MYHLFADLPGLIADSQGLFANLRIYLQSSQLDKKDARN